MSVPISWYLLLAAALFAIGVFGALARRNGLAVLFSIELMLNAANLTAVAFARQLGDPTGPILVVFVLLVAIVEATVGFSLFWMLYRQRQTIDLDHLDLMRG